MDDEQDGYLSGAEPDIFEPQVYSPTSPDVCDDDDVSFQGIDGGLSVSQGPQDVALVSRPDSGGDSGYESEGCADELPSVDGVVAVPEEYATSSQDRFSL